MDLRPKRLLLVEDNPAHARLMQIQFSAAAPGIHINWVMDGEEAIAFLRRTGPYVNEPAPDLILLDLKLPKIDGQEVLSQLKSDARLKMIPVVMVTTSQRDEDMSRAYEECVNAYLVKPFDFDQMREMVQATIEFWCSWNQSPRVNP